MLFILRVGLILSAFCGTILAPLRVEAGGFDRYDQDISLLFEEKSVVVDMLGSFVTSTTHYSTVDGVAENVPLIPDFAAGSLRIKFTPSDATACLAHLGQPFGTDVDFGPNWSRADVVVSQKFRVTEYGLTCSYRTPLAKGYLRGIAGVTRDSIDFEQTSMPLTLDGARTNSRLTLEGTTTSWRAGLAYEDPSKGLVASLMYFAPIDFDLHGNLISPAVTAGGAQPNLKVLADAKFPGAIEFSLRALIAPGWLSGITVKWADWSVLDQVVVRSDNNNGLIPTGTLLATLPVGFRDGLTVSFLLGHAITPKWSAWGRIAWDRGTTTGLSEHTQAWSLFGGVKHKFTESIEMSANLGVIWIAPGTIGIKNQAVPFTATFDDSIAFVPQLGLTTRF